MMIHELDTLPEYYQAVKKGFKPYEIRLDDRDYNVGDILILKDGTKKLGYSGETMEFKVIYKLDGGQFGIEKGYCIMTLQYFKIDIIFRTNVEACIIRILKTGDKSIQQLHDLVNREYELTMNYLDWVLGKMDDDWDYKDGKIHLQN